MKLTTRLTKVLSLAIIATMIVSCAQSDQVVSNSLIQKRKYNKGFYLAKSNKADKVENKKSTAVEHKAEVAEFANIAESSNEVQLQASVNNTPVVEAIENKEVKAKATNERAKEIIITDAALSKKAEKVIKKAEKKSLLKAAIENPDSPSAAAAAAGGKSQITALILCALIGTLGIHRFYLGYIWQGVVQLLTAGVCGIWTLIDLIRIITGALGPASGSYSKTL